MKVLLALMETRKEIFSLALLCAKAMVAAGLE